MDRPDIEGLREFAEGRKSFVGRPTAPWLALCDWAERLEASIRQMEGASTVARAVGLTPSGVQALALQALKETLDETVKERDDLRSQVERLTAELAKKGHSRDEVQHWADKWEAERAHVERLTGEREVLLLTQEATPKETPDV